MNTSDELRDIANTLHGCDERLSAIWLITNAKPASRFVNDAARAAYNAASHAARAADLLDNATPGEGEV